MMHAQAGNNVDFCRVVPVGFLVVVNGLEFVLLLLIKVSHLGENL